MKKSKCCSNCNWRRPIHFCLFQQPNKVFSCPNCGQDLLYKNPGMVLGLVFVGLAVPSVQISGALIRNDHKVFAYLVIFLQLVLAVGAVMHSINSDEILEPEN